MYKISSNRLKILAALIVIVGGKNSYAGDLTIHHSIISASTGWSVFASQNGEWNDFPFDGSLHSFGIGNEHFLIGTKILEYFSPTLAPQGTLDISGFPLYLYLTNGLYSGRSMRNPVVYGFLGVNTWLCGVLTEMDLDAIIHAGAGVKWTFWVASLNLAGDWRRDYWGSWQGPPRHGDIFSLKAGVELGGWWTTKDIAQFRTTNRGKIIFGSYVGICILPAIILLLQD